MDNKRPPPAILSATLLLAEAMTLRHARAAEYSDAADLLDGDQTG